jgi:hypothetical protein
LLLDLHPFNGGFRVTSGIFINNNEVTGSAQPSGSTIDIGGSTYNVSDIGTLDAKIDFRTIAPYLGIGWGNAVGKNSRLTISIDAGVMFQGTPNVSLHPSKDTSAIPGFNESLDKETADLKDDVKDLRYYPVVSLGLAYKF